MKATGIVRRIDDLGRVVIPKEIRRNLRIREGDPMEIYVDKEGEIILKKYSPIGELANFAREYAESINESLRQAVLIADRDSIIAVSGAPKKDFLGKGIGRMVERAMEERKTLLNNLGDRMGHEGAIIADDNGEDNYRFMGKLVTPIVAQGDPIGAVIICNRDDKTALGNTEHKIAETAAGFLGKQLEQ
jgi:AbrB family transcriptional regulator (stage V sporulation protein T)